MSLIRLLADFPNYSARKVRRLAKQLSLVEELQGAKELGAETGTLKGIASDLMEFNLYQARTEAQMNDDVRVDTPIPDTERWYGKDRNPTDLQDAIEQIEEMRRDWVHLAKNMGFDDYRDVDEIIERARLARPDTALPPGFVRIGPNPGTGEYKVDNKTENVVVTPVSEAMRAIDTLKEWVDQAHVQSTETLAYAIKRAKGIVSGSAFTTTKEISE